MPETALTATPLTERARNIAIIKRVWGRRWQLGVRIAACESRLQADASNPTNPDQSEDVGLFQINSIHAQPRHRMLDPVLNVEFAYRLFLTYGVTPWESSRHCWSRESEVDETR